MQTVPAVTGHTPTLDPCGMQLGPGSNSAGGPRRAPRPRRLSAALCALGMTAALFAVQARSAPAAAHWTILDLGTFGGSSSFDKYIVKGHLELGGRLKLVSWNGFVAQGGQRLDLLDWGSASSSFDSIDASGFQLAAGTALDFSRLYLDGSIGMLAAPEPAGWARWLAGLVPLQARRRACLSMSGLAARQRLALEALKQPTTRRCP